jgi:hypothetical protein
MTLTESTKKVYEANLNKLARETGLERDANEKWLAKHKPIMTYVNSLTNHHTRKTYLATILSYARTHNISSKVIKIYEDAMMDSVAEVQHTYETNEMSDRQKDNWVSQKEIDAKVIELREALPPKINTYPKYKQLTIYLTWLIHSILPLRNDLAITKIYNQLERPKTLDDEINYLMIGGNKPQLILNRYKTAKTYGQKILDLPKAINDELENYYDELTTFSQEHWFITRSGEDKPLSLQTFISRFQSVFPGRKVGTTMVRQSAVSELYKVSPEQYIKEQQLANIMSHSMSTSRLKYAKVLPQDMAKK